MQVVHEVLLGEPPTARPGVGIESNVAAFVVTPIVTSASPHTLAADRTLSIAVSPPIARDQRVVVLPGESALLVPARPDDDPPTRGTIAVTIPPGWPSGTHLLRVQVDGAMSPLVVDERCRQPDVQPVCRPHGDGPMMDVGAWRAHNDAYLATAVHWLRLRLEIFIAGGQGDGTALDALAERLREAEASEPPPALVLLSQAFGLSTFERHVLLLGVAYALDTGMADLFARAQDNPSRPHPTFALALALFEAPEWEALSVTRPLRYWRLIELSAHGAVPVTLAPLQADERIVHFAKGLNTIDERLLPVLVPATMPELPLPASQQAIADTIAQRHAATGRVLVQLAGPNRSSKASVAAAAAAAEGCQLRGLLPEALSQPPAEAETFVRLFQRERRLLPLALLVDLHDTDPTPLQIATVTRLASPEGDGIGGSVFVSVREASRVLSADALLVDVTTPTAEEQHDRWAEVAVPGRGCDAAARLAAQFDFDAAEIDRIADLASAGHGAPPACAALWRASVAFARPRLNGLAQRIDARATWKDIVLPPDTIRLLQHLAEQVRYRHQVHERWGWRARSARGLGVTALCSPARAARARRWRPKCSPPSCSSICTGSTCRRSSASTSARRRRTCARCSTRPSTAAPCSCSTRPMRCSASAAR